MVTMTSEQEKRNDPVKRRNLRFGINGSLLHNNPTGLSRYSFELISQLLVLLPDAVVYTQLDEFLEEYPKQTVRAGPPFRQPTKTISNSKRMLWQQLGLRARLVKDRRQLHFSPIAEGLLFPWMPQVITVHDALPIYDRYYMPRWAQYYRHVLPRLIRHSAVTVCISEFTREELLRLDPELPMQLLKVIYPGVNHERFHPLEQGLAINKFGLHSFLLLVGEGRQYKNPDVVIRALAKMKNPPELVICGRIQEGERRRIEGIAVDCGITHRIRWLGYVSDNDLRGLYADALALVFPSLYEGFGLPLLEAMACGTPVISSNAASLPEAGGDAACYFDPDCPDELEARVQELLQEPTRRQSLREQGLKHAAAFTWKHSAHAHLDLFGEILHSRQ